MARFTILPFYFGVVWRPDSWLKMAFVTSLLFQKVDALRFRIWFKEGLFDFYTFLRKDPDLGAKTAHFTF